MQPEATHLVTFDVATQSLNDTDMKTRTADRVKILQTWALDNMSELEIVQVFDLFGIAAIRTTPEAALSIARLPIVRAVERSRVLRASGV